MVKKARKTASAARTTKKNVRSRVTVFTAGKKLSEYYVPVLVLLLLVASFFVGRLSAQVEALKKGNTTAAIVAPTAQQPTQPTVTQDQLNGLFGGKNITFGNKDSKLVFVEFSDPSCPWCHVAAGKDPEVTTQMGKKLSTDGGGYVGPV